MILLVLLLLPICNAFVVTRQNEDYVHITHNDNSFILHKVRNLWANGTDAHSTYANKNMVYTATNNAFTYHTSTESSDMRGDRVTPLPKGRCNAIPLNKTTHHRNLLVKQWENCYPGDVDKHTLVIDFAIDQAFCNGRMSMPNMSKPLVSM